MKKLTRKRVRLCVALLAIIIGMVVGTVCFEFGRSMCYYAQQRASCYQSYSTLWLVISPIVGGACGFLVSVVLFKIIDYVNKSSHT